MAACECDWKNCHHKDDPNIPAADLGSVRSSPAYCTPCLFVCCGERDDEEDAQSRDGDRNPDGRGDDLPAVPPTEAR